MNSSSTAGDTTWLQALLERYRAAFAHAQDHPGDLVARYETLRLAAGATRQPVLADAASSDIATRVRHVVVVGPTQAGKSSLVNRLVGQSVAGVSALAGHTVHAQAFVPAPLMSTRLHDDIAAELLPLMATTRAELSQDELGSWSLQTVDTAANAIAPDKVVWDTPDFDSIAAGRYREAVLAPASLADVIVVVLSKDKYGDLSVWQRMQAIAALGTPMVIVLNKLDTASQGTVAAAFASRWKQQIQSPQPHTVLLPWMDDGSSDWPAAINEELRAALAHAHQQSDERGPRRKALAAFIDTHKDSWLSPLQEAALVRRRWQEHVQEIQQQALSAYKIRYLEDSARFDAVQRTIAELLTLLELPGIANAIARTRNVVTWPARTLLGLGRRQFGNDDTEKVDRELDVLNGIFKEAILAAREHARDAEDAGDANGMWRAIDRGVAADANRIEILWHDEAVQLREAFQPRLEAAARELHTQLEEQPALLNTLRATRVTTDAAGIAIAVKSGGLAPADLIIAPAMLSITSLLAESALGRYIDRIADRLKQELAELVRERLLENVLGNSLLNIEHALSDEGFLGSTLDPALERALDNERTPGN